MGLRPSDVGVRAVLSAAILLTGAGCRERSEVPSGRGGAGTPVEAQSGPAPTRVSEPASERPPERASPRPRLVVSVVLDQLATWSFRRYEAALPAEGALRRALEGGVVHRRLRYGYGATVTAAGHATLYTGVNPRVHGVVANMTFDVARGRRRAVVDDATHPVFGVPGTFAGPGVLRVPTAGDALREASGGRAQVASLSFKDRGAILPGGHAPSFVAFYAPRIPGFTTSAYYGEAPPPWLGAFTRRHPVSSYLERWTPGESARRRGGVDDRAVEGAAPGFGRAFPHDPEATEAPAAWFKFFPASNRYLADLAEETVRRLGLGDDEVPDLLCLSFSSTDYVGHKFGGDSVEYLDNLIRADRALGALVRALEARTSVAVLITSDHGHAPTPADPAPPRLVPRQLMGALEAHLAERFGEGPFVAGYHVPYVHLGAEARARDDAEAVLEAATAWLGAHPLVAWAARTEDAAGWTAHRDPLRRAVAEGIAPGRGGPIYVLPAEGVVVDAGLGGGTHHGTPYPYDREVPVLAFGTGVGRLVSDAPVDARRYAPTLARLLGVEPPRTMTERALPGFPSPSVRAAPPDAAPAPASAPRPHDRPSE